MINFRSNFYLKDVALVNFVNLSEDDKLFVLGIRNHDFVRKWMYSDKIILKGEHLKFIKNLINDDRNYYWLVKNKSAEMLGVVYLNRVDLKNKNAFLGIYVNTLLDRRRIGDILIRSIKQLVFEIAQLHTIKLEVLSENKNAINFYKRNGFIEEGRLKEFVYRNDKWHDVLIMGMVSG